mgnify:FL=1
MDCVHLYIMWVKKITDLLQGDGNVINSHDNNDIVITNRVIGNLRISTIIIERTSEHDAGVYICRNTEQVHDEVTVRIMNGKNDALHLELANQMVNGT